MDKQTILPQGEPIAKLIAALRESDDAHGGVRPITTRRYVQEYLLPSMARHGITVTLQPEGETLYRKLLCPKCEGGRKFDPLHCSKCQCHAYIYEPVNFQSQDVPANNRDAMTPPILGSEAEPS
jgi:hypothetical protein